MKAYCSIVVGQEIDGQNIVVKIEKISIDKSKIDALSNLKNPWTEQTQVPNGTANMFFQRNFQEIEVEDVSTN
jgi:hypothetical protein